MYNVPNYNSSENYLFTSRRKSIVHHNSKTYFICFKLKVESFTQTFSAVGFNTEFIRGMPFLKNFKTRLMALKRGHKALFSGYFRNIAITCTIEFCLMFS